MVPGLRELLWRYPFGEVFHRPGLDTKSRVVCAVAALTALRANAQIGMYAREHARAGLTREELAEVMVQVGPYAGFPQMLNALAILAERRRVAPTLSLFRTVTAAFPESQSMVLTARATLLSASSASQ